MHDREILAVSNETLYHLGGVEIHSAQLARSVHGCLWWWQQVKRRRQAVDAYHTQLLFVVSNDNSGAFSGRRLCTSNNLLG